MSGDLVRVDFHGDALWAAREGDDVFVAVRPICEAIGVDWEGQRQRIRRDAILSEGACMIKAPSRGGFQEALCLPLRLLNGWLFGIDARRVRKADVREKVIAYQRECHAVLFAYFHGADGADAAPEPAPPVEADPASAFDRADMRMLIALVSECRSVWGRPAAQRLWRKLPLPQPDEDMADDGDTVSAFLAAAVRRAPGGSVRASSLYAAYCRWCGEAGAAPLTQTGFGLRMARRAGRRRGAGGCMFYDGIALEKRE